MLDMLDMLDRLDMLNTNNKAMSSERNATELVKGLTV